MLKSIGAIITSYTDTAVQFRGGFVPFRPDVVLAGGVIEVTSGQLICKVKLSFANLFFCTLMTFVAVCLALLSGGSVIPVFLVATFASVAFSFGSKSHAENWLCTKLAQKSS